MQSRVGKPPREIIIRFSNPVQVCPRCDVGTLIRDVTTNFLTFAISKVITRRHKMLAIQDTCTTKELMTTIMKGTSKNDVTAVSGKEIKNFITTYVLAFSTKNFTIYGGGFRPGMHNIWPAKRKVTCIWLDF